MLDTPENVSRFRKLLPRGAQAQIARDLGITSATVSEQLSRLNPESRVVQAAVRIAEQHLQKPVMETEKKLRELLNIPEPGPDAAA